jgi:hypothetical protein
VTPARQARLVRNQELFRRANAGLERSVGGKVAAGDALPFLCECSDGECMDTVSLTLPAYQEVRSHPNRFFIVTGHQTVTGERVVSDENGYWIVEKSDES